MQIFHHSASGESGTDSCCSAGSIGATGVVGLGVGPGELSRLGLMGAALAATPASLRCPKASAPHESISKLSITVRTRISMHTYAALLTLVRVSRVVPSSSGFACSRKQRCQLTLEEGKLLLYISRMLIAQREVFFSSGKLSSRVDVSSLAWEGLGVSFEEPASTALASPKPGSVDPLTYVLLGSLPCPSCCCSQSFADVHDSSKSPWLQSQLA